MGKYIEPLQISPVVVSHNSEKYIEKFWEKNGNELGCAVTIVNSSDKKTDINSNYSFDIIEAGANVGFSAANNIGIRHCLQNKADFFLIANQDVLLPSGWLSCINKVLAEPELSDVGIFTVPLLAYEFKDNRPAGLIDSLGIEHTWYGHWYDVSQGESDSVLNKKLSPYVVTAACGALMLIRKNTVQKLLNKDGYVFNEAYFMYKEDIELSLRISKLGEKVMMIPSAPAFHCRGWANNRAESPAWARRLSAKNELNMHLKFFWRYLPYTSIKYVYVNTIERLLY